MKKQRKLSSWLGAPHRDQGMLVLGLCLRGLDLFVPEFSIYEISRPRPPRSGRRTRAFVACERPSVEYPLIHPQMRASTTHTLQKTRCVRHTQTGYLTINNGISYDTVGADALHTIHLRNLPLSESVYDSAGALQAQTQFEYDVYTEGLTASGAVGHDAAFNTAYTTRGNVTAVKRWRNTDAALLTTRNQYDDAGNVRKSVDPKGNPTTFSFADSWGNAACLPTGGSAAAYLTSTTNALGQVTTMAYDSCTGRPTSSTDANGQTTSLAYNDALERLTNVTRPAGGGSSNYTYDDTNHIIRTETDLNAVGDRQLKSESVYDGLGRTIETRQYESAFGFIAVDTTYDGLGRKKTVSNPFRSTTDSTYGLTTFGYDGLSRVTSVTTSDGAVVTTTYRGNAATVCDQANKQRRSATDALGRLTSVDEMYECPSTAIYATTTYAYDAQDNLSSVQQGVQTRSFVYNSLKQLTSATNPESGAVSYAYDANGNLISKTDARGITTSYAYDALNRVTSRSYSDLVTPAVSFTYDALGVANAKGRLTQVSSTASTTNYTGYDVVGRITGSSQTTNGQTYSLSYGYNLAGGLTSQTYPSGRIVTTSYDAAGRVGGVSGQKTGEANKTYASLLSYAPQGAINSMTLGNNLAESTSFNNRLQPLSISLGALATFSYTYGTTNNNGNVLSQQIIAPGFTVTQSYSSDPLNRLTAVCEPFVSGACAPSGWNQTYGYDQYGNRTGVTSSSAFLPTYSPAPTVNASSNRISDVNFAYDLAGNLTQAPPAPGAAVQTFAYDAENKLINFNGGTTTYAYDGDGRRVKKVVGTTTTVFVYNAPGQLVAEYTTPAPTTAGGTSYLTADHLGSTRLVTDASGAVISRHDYLPFGEEIPSGIGGRSTNIGYAVDEGIKQRFTGKERDTETGLDYLGARYYGSAMGRFISADIAPPSFSNPQSWNRYSYALNNPLKYIDSDGELYIELVSYEFQVTFNDKDEEGNIVKTTVNIRVNATLVFNDDGSLSSATFTSTANNAKGNDRNLTVGQLGVIGKTLGALFEETIKKDFGPVESSKSELSTAVATQESRLGINAPKNPLQLSGSSGTKPSKTDVHFNISKALDLLAARVRKYDLFNALAKYNAAADPQGYAKKVIQYYNQIRSSETKTVLRPRNPGTMQTSPIL